MSRGKQPFIQQQMNRTWIGHGSWQSTGRQTGAQAGRRAGWLAGWRADEQAGPSDANYCIAPLQVWRNTGTESGAQVSREDGCLVEGRKKKRREKRRDDRTMSKEEVAVSSYSCWCKKEEKSSLHLSPPVSAVENNSTARVKRREDRGILGVPQKPDGSHGDWGTSRPPQLLRLLLSINVFHLHHSPVYLSTKPETTLWKHLSKQQISFYSYLAGKGDTSLNKPICEQGGKIPSLLAILWL